MKKEKIIQILKKLDEESKIPTQQELEIDKEELGTLIEIMQEGRLISGTNVSRGGQGNKVALVWTDNAKITIQGIEYLEQNLK